MARFQQAAKFLIGGTGICLFLMAAMPLPYAQAGQAMFEKARTCQEKLMHSKKALRYRDRWEKCIDFYQAFIRTTPEHPLREEALFELSRLYAGLAKFSGKTQDFKKAQEFSAELKQKYPESHFIKPAVTRQDQTTEKPSTVKQKPARAKLNNVRYWSYPDYTRVVFDLTGEVTYSQEKESKPEHLWISLSNAQLAKGLDQKLVKIRDGILIQVEAVQETTDTVRVRLDLRQISDYKIIRFSDPERIVVDIFAKSEARSSTARSQPVFQQIQRIMIDPGHGGKDPGAIGRKGLTEKEVVLDIGLRLKELIKKNLGREVMMTRDRDIFIPLEERTQLANGREADLFISIHANASPNRNVRGIEIYTLGQATDSSALATAARENSIKEEALKNLDGVIKLMLSDLSVMRRFDHSLEFADATRQAFVKKLSSDYDMVDLGVKQAPFYVLMNADMPSILAEISFISNSVEEKHLAKRSYREKIAQALFEGVREYILSNGQEAKVQSLTTLE